MGGLLQAAGGAVRAGLVWTLLATVLATTSGTSTASSSGAGSRRWTTHGDAGVDLFSPASLETVTGLVKVKPRGWLLHNNFTGFHISTTKSADYLNRFYGDFSFTLTCRLLESSHGSLLTVRHSDHRLPHLDLQLDARRSVLTLRYLGVKSYQRIKMRDVFPASKWTQLQVDLLGKELVVHVDCGEGQKVTLRQGVAEIPSDAVVWFGAKNRRQSGLQGIVFDGILSVRAEPEMERCIQDNSKQLAADQPVISESGFALEATLDDKVAYLEQQVSQLVMMVDMLKQQNSDLTSRVTFLETCECHPSCSFNGTTFTEGQLWAPDMCTVCECVHGRPSCRTRMDVPSCAVPCMASPCEHAGTCQDVISVPGMDIRTGGFQCQCPPPFTGPTCQFRHNPCVWPPAVGNCDGQFGRFYYDRITQQCLPFNYTGCGGNMNNYEHVEQCVRVAMEGACCYRTFSTTRDSILNNRQNLQLHCKVLHVGECEALHRPQGGLEAMQNGVIPTEDSEVVSFYPGLSCEDAGCSAGVKNCTVGQQMYTPGEIFRLGCQQCTCQEGGILNCTCRQVDSRRELRDMTREEVVRFQRAVSLLRLSEDRVWEQFRDLYMTHRMHASGAPYFLPWHRYFLRQVEQKLQEIDCSIVLPYFDFTTDVGNLSDAIIWQANFFGGDGNEEGGDCVLDHPFGDPNAWEPCLTRRFNTSVQLPTQVELAIALASDDFMDMSLCLETAVAYVHAYIGGDMMTASGPYDPLFYAVHAYIDMLYWSWQQKANNRYQFPAAYGNIPLVPFNILPWKVFDSEGSLCVTYMLPSRGAPCNVTEVPVHPTQPPSTKPPVDLPDRQRGDIPVGAGDLVPVEKVDEVDLFGYDVDGFDRAGYNIFGYNREGFNRDGFDRNGFDYVGFNRYGIDVEGYSFDGFNTSGIDRSGNIDLSERYGPDGYDVFCFNRQGLNPQGFDQYGYTVQGYDADFCNFHFKGPFAPRQSLRIFDVLNRQKKAFLMSLPRTCLGLGAVPDTWLKQTWVTERKIIAGMVGVQLPSSYVSIPTQRFCFNTDMFLTACTCREEIAVCENNPCLSAACSAFPEATCHINFCGECTAQWILEGQEVDCSTARDFCKPNPCQHGGSCVPSVWANEPHLVTCVCPPGYDGHLCQNEVQDVCSLPLSTGRCEQQETRWYFNYRTDSCQKFIYTGCDGNSNNFPTEEACKTRCVKGACCFREPFNTRHPVGYDDHGYNRYGFNIEGVDRLGKPVSVETGTASGSRRFDEDGYDWQGFDIYGFNQEGFNRYAYDREGFDLDGFNLTGYNAIGEYDGIIEYDDRGYDPEGFNRAGFNCHGHDRRGYDVYGVLQGFKYSCRPLTKSQCQEIESHRNVEVVRFTPGKACSETACGVECGCQHGNHTYMVGQEFQSGCQSCMCMKGGQTVCVCDYAAKRREVRELSQEEMQKYQAAVRQLTTQTGYSSQWFKFASQYAFHKPQAVGSPAFLPWHRRFLLEVERALQAVDCSVALPYYDWTLDVGDPARARVWAANMFGGNGRWDECVRYHPFKDYHPPLLAPCLRRRFNESVSLPDAVNVQLALNEEEYDRFRVHMEMFATLFQSFVGGHMESDYAPYDPIFYSIMAYIDKLWDDWQRQHQDGLLRYPQNRRFVPLAPFSSTPDDVMDSRVQLCVDYLPLLDGAPCNTSVVRQFGYDLDGYDRHGYNRNGFDRDGYTIKGVDRDGNIDTRGVYNSFGYDRDGYSRSGYDKTGFDRFGFYVDTYNLDGFDPFGYDQSGYDRYGFDRQGYTPFGFNKNGSYRPEVVPTDLQIYDPYGYNIYGYNKFGFDRNGYDVFGFDMNGFNRRICNFYHLGPITILVKKIVEEKLKTLGEEDIKLVHRICSEMTPLAAHQLRNNWLSRAKQQDVIDVVYMRHQDLHRYDPSVTPRNTSVLSQMIWLPVAPDERLCIMTQAFTPCSLHEPPVLCPRDLCLGRSCPGHPTAVCRVNSCGECKTEWYDGVTGNLLNCTGCMDVNGDYQQDGDTWHGEACNMCTCQEGMVVCTSVDCEPALCNYPVKLPDQCCPSCQGCDYGGQIIPSGQPVNDPQKPCSQCFCEQGNVECTSVVCADLGTCRSPTVLEGECCPVCLDCGQYANGDQWTPSPCQRCSCLQGDVHCEKIQCPPAECDHPYTPQGQCCSVCEACFYQGSLYRDGEQFQPDSCTSCSCQRGNIQCTAVDCPPALCAKPIRPPRQCCPACDLDCDYEGETYKHTSDFTPAYNPCLNCSCDNSIVRCRPVHCPALDLPCTRPEAQPGQCCPTACPKCSVNGRDYYDGDTWQSTSDPCEVCECRDGVTTCLPQKACPVRCTHGVVIPGDCCSACTDCMHEGRIIDDGRQITLPGSPCRECQCRGGNLNCRRMPPCPRLPCVLSDLPEGRCCPECVGCAFGGRDYKYGDVVSQTDCMRCVCEEGQIMCRDQQELCPPVRCQSPRVIPGQCCPVCDGCDYYGRYYEDGQSFPSERDPCERCTCQRGEVSCSRQQIDCPTPSCTHPARVRHQCCPQCRDCQYQRRLVRNGQRFSPPRGDPCTICQCQDGSVSCERQQCPPVNCATPTTPHGECCPQCPTVCTVDGRERRDGETFSRPGDECSTCQCTAGEVVCERRSCASTPCSHPATLPGECCPRCNFCLYDRRIFRNMQRFLQPGDPCQECACQQGSVTCQRVSCPELTCSRPMPMAGQCCPVCPKQCQHEGLTYDDGETFTSLRSPCDECLCRQGRVQCKRRMCPQVACRHPRKNDCCPTCDGCSFGNVQVANGQTFQDPRDGCRICVCQSGEVDCTPQSCPPAPCRHPSMRDCCPVCQDCDYQGQTVLSGTIFNDPRDECQQCQCEAGTVVCQRKVCTPVTCLHPVKRGCCQDCSACMYRGRHYRQGQSFSDPDSPCGECHCGAGTVSCQQRVCPPVTCSSPVQGPCCPECRDCEHDGRLVRNGEKVAHATDTCQECQCRRGSMACFSRECPQARCRDPVTRDCCPVCDGCLYRGTEYPNGAEFKDASDQCNTCQCINGNAVCQPARCPSVTCTHPVNGQCCPECSRCFYNNLVYGDGEQFPHPLDQCQRCVCQGGSVRCMYEDCSKTTLCSHPVSVPGLCCPVCGEGCDYQGQRYQEGQTFDEDCQECLCQQGSVRCQQRQCPPVPCPHPVTVSCCPVCTDCLYQGRHYRNGQTLPDRSDQCGQCSCQDGTFSCERAPCPPVACLNPAPGECCPECEKCLLDGRVYQNGERFIDRSNRCHRCICEYGSVNCERSQCEQASCPHPVMDECGCGSCQGCQYSGQKYRSGESFDHPADPCQQCRCQSGNVRCATKPCERVCAHPVKVTECCPLCTDCLYEGIVRLQGVAFISEVDPCQQCMCQEGTVECHTLTCPEVTCLNPIRSDRQCCPTCPVCQFLGQTFDDNSRFTHPEDGCQKCSCKEGRVSCEKETCVVECTHPRQDLCCPRCDMCFFEGHLHDNGQSFQPDNCRRCLCLDGNVVCEVDKCPELNCLLTEPVPGQCCPQCKGCDYHETHYASNTTFLVPDNPCVSCACTGGLVTCMEVECYVPCDNPVPVPGQCCPVCPTCNYGGISYRDGEEFSPNGDTCDICSCDEGRMQCLHQACPSVANCPAESLVAPPPGECCPSCAGLSTGCTVEDLGTITRPRPHDPCFYCECKDDFSWVCVKEQCDMLDCPPDVQISMHGQCCPVCPACYDRTEARYHHEGEQWYAVENPCISCLCQDGEIICALQECAPLSCGSNERLRHVEGQCCEICEPLAQAECFYQGRTFQPGEEWIVDECTRCRCQGGSVSCSIQDCPLSQCQADEVRATSPGQCCPVCLKQPGSCVVFGDPHYRTFDGATLHFQGTCRYIMASDCEENKFRVDVQHDNRNAPGEVSWAQNFTVTVGDIVVDLLQNSVVQVNGAVVDLPFLYEPHIFVELTGRTVLLTTEIGLQVFWNGDSHAEVRIPGSFKRKLCGLCGNFNGFPQDDLRTSFGQITNSPAVFGNSWKSTVQLSETCQDARDTDPCQSAGYRVRKIATTRCAIIKSSAFTRCHRVVSPEPYFSSCVYDMCVCLDDPKCLCDILESYAHECARAGVKLEWRSRNLCAFECPKDKGFMFDECGPACLRTCENLQTPLGNLTTNCFKPCVPSCQCTADKVVHEGRCISPDQCPHIQSHTVP